MQHDIIDNRTIKLVDKINEYLPGSQAAKFAVGYFFLSGLEAVAEHLDNITELKLLIGNTSNRETIEQIAEGYRRLEQAAQNLAENYPTRRQRQEQALETATQIGQVAAALEQSDETEQLITTLVQLIETGRLQVRVYARGRLHAKAYIFDYGQVFNARGQPLQRGAGVAIVGSSNFTLSGIHHNTELNVVVYGDGNHAQLTAWFNQLWKEAEPFEAHLMTELQQSWPLVTVTPYEIYLKTLYELTRDRLDDETDGFMWQTHIMEVLADFQRSAVKQAVQMIKRYRGCFVSDVVGLGKSYIGAAIVKQFEQSEGARPLIICPAPLVDMWEGYNEVYHLNARVLSMGILRDRDDSPNPLLQDDRYRNRNLVLIDESHNFRNSATQRYRALQDFLDDEERLCVLLTATPRNKSARDIYNQMRLFHLDDTTTIPIDPPDLKQYFKQVEEDNKSLPDLLSHVLIRRTRNDILRFYGYDDQTHEKVDPDNFEPYRRGERRAYVEIAGQPHYFPRRRLQTIDYSIETTYDGLYDQLKNYIGAANLAVLPDGDYLRYTRYGLYNYVKPGNSALPQFTDLKRAGTNLRGLMRVSLFKRFESSVQAFRASVRRMLTSHQAFERALDEGIIATGEEAQTILYEADRYEEQELLDALRAVEKKYNLSDFQERKLRADIRHDIQILEKIYALVAPITPDKDDKLQTLKRWLYTGVEGHPPLTAGKCLIFTQYADTAQYLYEQLNPNDQDPRYAVIYSQSGLNKSEIVARFAPKANTDLWQHIKDSQTEIELLVATDVLSEGLNMQDCDCVVNYDLHWNPVRLIQRFGRIDRIGSLHDEVYGYNFLPETELERNLHLQEILSRRIQEIHDTIGEDTAILDPSEQLNEEAVYAIYQNDSAEGLDVEEDELVNLNEAEEIIRRLEEKEPELFERITNLRDGVRCGREVDHSGAAIVLCRAGTYRQLYLVDERGHTLSTDTRHVLGLLKCSPDTPPATLPDGHNGRVRQTKETFGRHVQFRRAEQEVSLTKAQQYISRELRLLHDQESGDDIKGQIGRLDTAFRQPLSQAVKRRINGLARQKVTGRALLDSLNQIYHDYNLEDNLKRHRAKQTEDELPVVVCSLGVRS